MNMYAKKGDKVSFNYPRRGEDSDEIKASQYLVEGQVYTVRRTLIDSWRTDVYLEEIPGQCFNSVMFDDVETNEVPRRLCK